MLVAKYSVLNFRRARRRCGGLGGVAAAGLTALAIGVSPVYALVMSAAACGGMDITRFLCGL